MSLFRFPKVSLTRVPRLRPRRQPLVRPQLEALEDRTLLNSRFVVPAADLVNNVTTFATLSAALTTPGLTTPALIQIEPGAQPGSVSNANLTVTPPGGVLNIASAPNGATETGSTVTITTTTTSGSNSLFVGETVQISGVGVAGYNGTFAIQSVTGTSFTYTSPVVGLAPSGGGTVSFGSTNSSLTIQGDLAFGLTSIPEFTILDAETISLPFFAFNHVNVAFIDAGQLTFTNSVNIAACSLVDVNSTAKSVLNFSTGTASNPATTIAQALTNSTLTLLTPAQSLVVVTLSTAPVSSNLIANDTFVDNNVQGTNNTGSSSDLLAYTGQGNANTEVADQINDNTFLGNPGSGLSALVSDSDPGGGLLIQNNSFSDSDPNAVGLAISSGGNTGSQSTTVTVNTFNLPGSAATAIAVTGGNSLTQQVLITDNQISTSVGANGGTGLSINHSNSASSVMIVEVAGNSFHNNQIGVLVTVNGSTAPADLDIDLGGGNLGSLGGNDFRGFNPATASQGAIVVAGVNPGSPTTISAKDSIESNASLAYTSGLGNATVLSSSPLTGNAAFVEVLYEDFLRRAGDTTNPSDAGYWVNLLNAFTLTEAQVATDISRSAASLTEVVDEMYEAVLNRAADPSGQTMFVNYLSTGGTLEGALATMVTTSEFLGPGGTNTTFVVSLYQKLLGRNCSNGELSYWVAQASMYGMAYVANSVLASAEFRGDVVDELYGAPAPPSPPAVGICQNLLHRTTATAPSAGDVTYWVTYGGDSLTMTVAFAVTPEYYSNG